MDLVTINCDFTIELWLKLYNVNDDMVKTIRPVAKITKESLFENFITTTSIRVHLSPVLPSSLVTTFRDYGIILPHHHPEPSD